MPSQQMHDINTVWIARYGSSETPRAIAQGREEYLCSRLQAS